MFPVSHRTFRWRELLAFQTTQPLVVSVARQDGGPPRRVGREALYTTGQVFRNRSSRLTYASGEREIRRALSAAGSEKRCRIYQVCSEAPLGIFCNSTRADLGVAAQIRST